jgi:hypothetical protein
MMRFRLNLVFLFCALIVCTFFSENVAQNVTKDSYNRERKLGHNQQGINHHKMYQQHNSSHETRHNVTWKALEEVDGLRNEDVVMLITTTWKKNFFYFRSRFANR